MSFYKEYRMGIIDEFDYREAGKSEYAGDDDWGYDDPDDDGEDDDSEGDGE